MLAFLAAASAMTVIDAERAFARDAQVHGQWTAFRKWSEDDAVMFAPQAVWVKEYLKDEADPPAALDWTPADSWISCDRRTAINKGPWRSASGKAHGYFTTVWMQKASAWRWVYDGGDSLSAPLPFPRKPRIHRASCANLANIPAAYRQAVIATASIAGQPPADAGQGRSADGTLIYEWKVAADGARHFMARLWNGRGYRVVLDQSVAAPAK